MDETLVWETEHHFRYDAPGEVTAEALANNLLGLVGVFESSAKVVGTMLGLSVKDTEIVLRSVELGSYKDHIIYRIIFGEGEDAERKLEELRKILKLDKMDGKTLAGFAIAGSIAYGAYGLVNLAPKASDETPSVNVTIDHSFVSIGGELGMSKEEAFEVFSSTLKDDEKLKRSVVQLARPSADTTPGKVVIDQNEALTIPKEVVAQVPQQYEKPAPIEQSQVFENAQIVVRAVDLDKPATGWWAIIPEVSDRRLSVVVDSEVPTDAVPVGKYFFADVEVFYKLNKAGERIPKKILLLRMRKS